MTNLFPRWGRALLLLALPCASLAQNVGIGTTAPTQTLDVNGQLRVRGLSGSDTRLPVVRPDGTLGVNAPVYGTAATIPAFPTAATGSVGTGDRPVGLVVSGTTAYVVNRIGNTLQTFDVANPTGPVLLGSIATDANPIGVAVSGTTAYVVSQAGNTLQVFDVASPASPVLLGSVATGSNPSGVAVGGTTAYVVSIGGNALEAFDVANPASPVLLGSVGTGNLPSGSLPVGVAVSGTTAYVVNRNTNALEAFDVANPASPVRRGGVFTDSGPRGVVVRGTTAYVVNGTSNTLQTFDVANPASPVLLGSVGTGSLPFSVAVSGTTAYVVNLLGNTLQAFDVANPANPVLLGSVGTGTGPIGVAVRGTTVYVANNTSNTLQAFSFPLPPRAVAVQADGSLTSVALPSATDFIQNGTSPQAANFNVSGAGTVGGRLAAGSARIGNLTTAGIVTTDASGNLGSSTGSGSFIQNTTAPQAGSNFNVSGAGTVGGLLTAGSAAVTGSFNVSGAGGVGGLLTAGSARINNLTTAGIVTTDAGGNLGSSTATTAFGTSFIQNTTAAQASSNFNVSGTGTVGGLLTAGSASVTGDVLAGANVVVDAGSANAGTLAGTLRLGGSGSGEAIGSKRTAGGNQYGLDFYTNSASRLSIGLNGNVGIGTAVPVQLLDVSGTPAAAAAGTLPLLRFSRPQASGVRFANAFEVNVGAFGTTSNATTQVDFRLSNGQTDTPDMTALTLRSDGNVGIGTTSPAFPLDVQATATPANYAYAFYAFNPGARTGTATSTGAVSIRASGRVVAAEFNAVSDRRLKTVVGRSDTGADLALLNRLRITDYTMRDRVQFGDRAFKKVIAQEVEAVFPQAVRQHTGFLPDVYALATVVAALPGDSLVALTLPAPGLPVAAAAGRRLQLIGAGAALPGDSRVALPRPAPGRPGAAAAGRRLQLIGAGGEVPAALARPAAAGARTLVLRRAQALAGAGGPVFVFGLEHADVRAVDYEALGMLNVSATQELARQVRALQTQNAALQARTAADHASLQTVQQQLTRLLGEGAPAAAQARR